MRTYTEVVGIGVIMCLVFGGGEWVLRCFVRSFRPEGGKEAILHEIRHYDVRFYFTASFAQHLPGFLSLYPPVLHTRSFVLSVDATDARAPFSLLVSFY